MNQRRIIYALYIFLAIFSLNILLFYTNSGYNDFIQELKYGEKKESEEKIVIGDEYGIYSPSPENVKFVLDNTEVDNKNLETDSETGSGIGTSSIIPETNTGKVAEMGNSDLAILNHFSDFSLKRIFEHPSLFDLTTEYPDDYIEYVGNNIVLYFFTTKGYDEVYNIFDALSNILPFTVKQVDTFGSHTFFINVNNEYTDGDVRFVTEYKKRVFGLKIKKDDYNQIKQILNTLP